MEKQANTEIKEQNRETDKIVPDWTESEWFQVWLKLARRDYHANAG